MLAAVAQASATVISYDAVASASATRLVTHDSIALRYRDKHGILLPSLERRVSERTAEVRS